MSVSPARSAAVDHERGLRAQQHLALIDPVRDRATEESEQPVGAELADREDADRERRVGVLHDEPCLGDALHPRAADGHDLPEEIEAVVVMPAQAHEGARGGVADAEAHSACASSASSGAIAAGDGGEVRVGELAEPGGQPGGPLGADRLEHALSFGGDLEVHPAPVAFRLPAGDQPGRLETVDVAAHRRHRRPFASGQLGDPDARGALDQAEQRELSGRDTRGVHLAAQMAVQVEQHRTEPVGDVDGFAGGGWSS